MRLAWSADSNTLYAFAVESGGLNGAEWTRQHDLYRVPLDGGEATNLTKCGLLGNASWIVGGDVFFSLDTYSVDPAKHGFYRVSIDKLEQAMRAFSAPKSVDLKAALARISERVKGALGGASVDAVTLTPGVIANAALGVLRSGQPGAQRALRLQ